MKVIIPVLELLGEGEGGGVGFPHTTYRRPWHYNSSTHLIPPFEGG